MKMKRRVKRRGKCIRNGCEGKIVMSGLCGWHWTESVYGRVEADRVKEMKRRIEEEGMDRKKVVV